MLKIQGPPTPVLRRVVALAALIGAIALIVASFQVWLNMPDGAGGTTHVSGWGSITGGSQISGQNLNDALNGNATFRPGVIPLIFGGLAVIPAVVLAIRPAVARPHRIPAAVLALCGLAGLGWGLLRIFKPDSLGILDPGQGSTGAGQWLTAVGGLMLILVSVAVMIGVLDPPDLVPRRRNRPVRRRPRF